MRHLADPALLEPGLASWLFLVAATVLLPAAAIAQERRLAALPELPDRPSIYISALVTHGLLLLGAWFALRDLGIGLAPPWTPHLVDVAAGLALLAAGLAPLLERFSSRDTAARARTELIAPRTTGERAGFTAVAVSAGVAEEVAYRGVVFLLLAHLLPGWWLAAVVAAAAFGAAHAFQGWRGAVLAGILGLGGQVVVGFTGTLAVVIVVHVLHDLIAGAVISRRARRRPDGGAPLAVP